MDSWIDLGLFSGSDIGIGVAFLAGFIAFFSPCILPVIPAYVSYFAGVGIDEAFNGDSVTRRFYRQKVFKQALLFVLGFLAVFVLLGLATGALASFLAINKALLQKIGGVFMMLLGVYLMEIFKIPWLYRQVKINIHEGFTKIQWLNSLLAGVTFGFAWTPCIGPVLASILLLATFAGGSTQGVILLVFFALGLGIPFIIVAVGIQRLLPVLRRFSKYTAWIHKLTGAFVFLMGVLLVTGVFNLVLGYFIRLSQPFI